MTALKADRNQAYLFAVLATLFWAGNAIAGKMAVGHVSPFVLTFFRSLIAILVIAPFAIKYVKKDWPVLRKQLWFLGLMGAIGLGFFNNLLYWALENTSALNVAIIQSSLPLFVFLLSFALFRKKTNRMQTIGFALTFIGVIVIAFQGSLTALVKFNINFGDLLMFAAIATYSLYSVLLSKKPDVHWLSSMFIILCGCFLASIPFMGLEFALNSAQLPDISGLLAALYTGVFASVLAQSFWLRSINELGANATGMFINLVPLFGSALAILLLGETFKLFHAIGIILILIGTTVSQTDK